MRRLAYAWAYIFRIMRRSSPSEYRVSMNSYLAPSNDVTSHDVYETLCAQARALSLDAELQAVARRGRFDMGEVLRCALDLLPALEVLPLEVLARELDAVLRGPKRGARFA